jgi:hypothetical protein
MAHLARAGSRFAAPGNGDEHGRYETGAWVRYPPGSRHTPQTDDGCTLYVKNGHLVPASP